MQLNQEVMGTGVTQINADYLNTLKNQLGDLQTQVESRLKGIGQSSFPGTTLTIGPVDNLLGSNIEAGGANFDAATALTAALNSMGGSVHDQLTWLNKVLTDMINEITDTVAKFSANEALNTE